MTSDGTVWVVIECMFDEVVSELTELKSGEGLEEKIFNIIGKFCCTNEP